MLWQTAPVHFGQSAQLKRELKNSHCPIWKLHKTAILPSKIFQWSTSRDFTSSHPWSFKKCFVFLKPLFSQGMEIHQKKLIDLSGSNLKSDPEGVELLNIYLQLRFKAWKPWSKVVLPSKKIQSVFFDGYHWSLPWNIACTLTEKKHSTRCSFSLGSISLAIFVMTLSTSLKNLSLDVVRFHLIYPQQNPCGKTCVFQWWSYGK